MQIEDLFHLFFGCQFSKEFWHSLGYQWEDNHNIMAMLQHGRITYRSLYFKEILIIGAWAIWNHRNKIIFDGDSRDRQLCITFFKENFNLASYRAKPSLKEGMLSWLDTL